MDETKTRESCYLHDEKIGVVFEG